MHAICMGMQYGTERKRYMLWARTWVCLCRLPVVWIDACDRASDGGLVDSNDALGPERQVPAAQLEVEGVADTPSLRAAQQNVGPEAPPVELRLADGLAGRSHALSADHVQRVLPWPAADVGERRAGRLYQPRPRHLQRRREKFLHLPPPVGRGGVCAHLLLARRPAAHPELVALDGALVGRQQRVGDALVEEVLVGVVPRVLPLAPREQLVRRSARRRVRQPHLLVLGAQQRKAAVPWR